MHGYIDLGEDSVLSFFFDNFFNTLYYVDGMIVNSGQVAFWSWLLFMIHLWLLKKQKNWIIYHYFKHQTPHQSFYVGLKNVGILNSKQLISHCLSTWTLEKFLYWAKDKDIINIKAKAKL